jgi:hypothetical protein
MPEHVLFIIEWDTGARKWWCGHCGSVFSGEVGKCVNNEIPGCKGASEQALCRSGVWRRRVLTSSERFL